MSRSRIASVTVDFEGSALAKVAEDMEPMARQIMGRIGRFGRKQLESMVVGSASYGVTLRAHPTDSRGNNTINSRVRSKGVIGVAIDSYPLNFFENGRVLRSGRKEPGKKIITGKLATVMRSRLDAIAEKEYKSIMEPALQKALQ